MRKKPNYVAKEVQSQEYVHILKTLEKLTKRVESSQDRLHLHSLLKGIIISYCQPDITFNRIGAMLNFVGISNLEILAFMDELKKVKQKIDSKRVINNESV